MMEMIKTRTIKRRNTSNSSNRNVSGNKSRENNNKSFHDKSCASMRSNAGFSLIEVSIALIIMGLLLAGVMKGFHLIENAKVKSTITQINNYRLAVSIFKERYGYLPGDFPKANYQLPGDTNNGDGDGIIKGELFAASSPTNLFWKHLSLSGLIEGIDYASVVDGMSYPRTKLGSFVSVQYKPHDLPGHWFVLADRTEGGRIIASLTPEQAFALDKSMDNGDPGSGNVRSFNGDGKCLRNNGYYNLDNKDRSCIVYIKF